MQTDMMKLIVALRNFGNASKNDFVGGVKVYECESESVRVCKWESECESVCECVSVSVRACECENI